MGVLGVICGTKVMKCETNLKKQVGKFGEKEYRPSMKGAR